MNKAFTKEDDGSTPPPLPPRFAPLPAGLRNLVTPAGAARLRLELSELEARRDAPGGKDQGHLAQQIAELSARLKTQIIFDPGATPPDRIGFGATVTVLDSQGVERTYTLVGLDETNPSEGRISWTSPVARALMNGRSGSLVQVASPGGDLELEIVSFRYG